MSRQDHTTTVKCGVCQIISADHANPSTIEDFFSYSIEYRVKKGEFRVIKVEYRVIKVEYRVMKVEYRVINTEAYMRHHLLLKSVRKRLFSGENVRNKWI